MAYFVKNFDYFNTISIQEETLVESILGTDGDDIISLETTLFLPNSSIDGGEGFDILDLSIFTDTVNINLSTGTLVGGFILGSSQPLQVPILNIEGLIGGSGDDSLTGDNTDNLIAGGDGNDDIFGLGGDDTFIAGAGDDNIDGGDGADTLTYQPLSLPATASIRTSSSDQNVTGEEINEAGNVINENIGHVNDINLATGLAVGIFTGTDTLSNIENVVGSDDGDHIIGDAGNNIIFGSFGDDHLEGGDGDDILDGGFNDDRINGFDTGSDLIEGGAGNDTIIYSRDDTGSTDIDTVDGGTGIDTFVFSNITFFNRSIDLSAGVYTFGELDSGGPTRGFISNIENVEVIGAVQVRGDEADNVITVSGQAGDNQLEGMGGNDTIFADLGNDTVFGGAGSDEIHGGAGDDMIFGEGPNFFLLGEDIEGDYNDIIDGGTGNDIIFGGLGDDFLDGGVSPGDSIDIFAGFGMGSGSVVRAAGAGNDSIANAIDISNDFALFENPNVSQSDINPHLTISGVGENDRHFYSFTITEENTTLLFDIDFAGNSGGSFDSWLNLFDADGNFITSQDDNGNDPGSFSAFDSMFSYTFLETGTFIIQVEDFLDDPIPVGGDYELQISIVTDDGESSGNDEIFGEEGNDTLLGREGDDFLNGGTGNDTIDGGDGIDTASFEGFSFELIGEPENATNDFDLTVDLEAGTATGEFTGTDTLISIENVIGSFQNDEIFGNADDNVLTGLEGDDYLQGRGGNDTLFGDNNSFGIALPSRLDEGQEDFFNEGDDILDGGDGDDILFGGFGNDILIGGSGADMLFGEFEDIDTFAEADDADGDSASYETALEGVRADLQGLVAATGDALGDVYVSIENLIGSDFNDRLYGDAANNRLYGGEGNDALFGRNGDDHLFGEDGNDFLIAGSGNDILEGGDGDDQIHGNNGDDWLLGGAGNDFLTGGAGADIFDGGDGIDRAQYTGGTNEGVVASLLDSSINTGDAAGDTYIDIENLYGTSFEDELHGDNNNNRIDGLRGDDVLLGLGGDDFIIGGGGDDILIGGEGNDFLFGQAGADQFWFGTGHGNDRITSFEDGTDLIVYDDGITEFADLTIEQSGTSVLITSVSGTVQVLNAMAADFTEDDFIFSSLDETEMVSEYVDLLI